MQEKPETEVRTCPTCRRRFQFVEGSWIACDDGSDEERDVLRSVDSHEAKTLCLTCATPESLEAAIRKPG